MQISPKNVFFAMVDIQEKLSKKIFEIDKVVRNANILNKTAEILDIPLLITEQYPKGLGKTLSEIYIPKHSYTMEKSKFSIFDEGIQSSIEQQRKKYIILYGTETHVCLTQSAIDCKERNLIPIVVVDAVSSRTPINKEIGLKRLEQEGAVLVSTEMIIFEILKDSLHPKFKEISNLIV